MKTTPRIRGFADLFAPLSEAFSRMEAVAREVFSLYGYKEIRLPLLEHTDLFVRGIGAETDVVQKEMYTFEDRGGRSVTLRPEATAGIMRAYLESGMSGQGAVSRLFTFGPMFRYERPQKGRMRQFHQIDVECLGSYEPYVDAEMICMVMSFLYRLKIVGIELNLNTLGCSVCRPAYRDLLRSWLLSLKRDDLCADCQRRMYTNPLRVLDCKVESCRAQTLCAPVITDYVCENCSTHFSTVRDLLTGQGISFIINPRLVRGLDYYTRTAFEINSSAIGSQGAIAGGGRYDNLSSELGGGNIPAIGFACGMERLALLVPQESAVRPDFYIIVLTGHKDQKRAMSEAFSLCQTLRNANFTGDMDSQPRSIKSSMRQANKNGARLALILGPDELETDKLTVKFLDEGRQELISMSTVTEFFIQIRNARQF